MRPNLRRPGHFAARLWRSFIDTYKRLILGHNLAAFVFDVACCTQAPAGNESSKGRGVPFADLLKFSRAPVKQPRHPQSVDRFEKSGAAYRLNLTGSGDTKPSMRRDVS